MAYKLEIQSEIRKKLKPSTPTPNHLRTLNLSFLDQLAPCLYVPILLYYDSVKDINVCAKLEKTLADALAAKFYPLAGRLRKDEDGLSFVDCNDEGVEYVETKVNADLAGFLSEKTKVIDLLKGLLPWPEAGSLKTYGPLLGIQVNVFNCGGLVIGIQMSHVLADACTLGQFIKEWSQISLESTTSATKMNLGIMETNFTHLPSLVPTRRVLQPSIPDPPPPSGIYNGAAYYHNNKIVTRRFVFDGLAIAKLKGRVSTTTGAFRVTRVVVVKALIWKVLAGFSYAKHGGHPRWESHLIFTINLRGKLDLPSIQLAPGNFAAMFEISTLKGPNQINDHDDALDGFVNLVGNAIRDTCQGISKARNSDDISSLVSNNHNKVVNLLTRRLVDKPARDAPLCSSWCNFPWYGADFGWGKPLWVSTASDTLDGIIRLIDTKDGTGIEAWVCLNEKDMADFERDIDILTYSTF